MKLLQGFAAPYMLGLVLGVATVSTTVGHKAAQKGEEYKQQYMAAKQENVRDLNEKLKQVYYTDSTANDTVTKAKLEQYSHSNAFDVASSLEINQIGTIAGEKRTIIGKNVNKRKQALLAAADSNNVLKQDLSGQQAVNFSEKDVRQTQIEKSYTSMKKQAQDIYSKILDSGNLFFTDTVTHTQKDAWGREFDYNKESNLLADLSFTLPWDENITKVLPLKLPKTVNYKPIKKIVVGGNGNTYLLTASGHVWVTGANSYGELGLGHYNNINTWEKTSLTNIKDIATRAVHSWAAGNAYALTNDGEVWAVGRNYQGPLGLGDSGSHPNWEKTHLRDVKEMYANNTGIHVLTNSGEVWAAGSNAFKYLGVIDGSSTSYWRKLDIDNVKKYIARSTEYTSPSKAVGGQVSFLLTNNDELWGIGYNNYGHLGTGNTDDVYDAWIKIPIPDVKDAWTASGRSSYVLTNSGEVWVAGLNEYAELGIGNQEQQLDWVKTSLSDIKEVVPCGGTVVCAFAITNTGDVWATGSNGSRRLGFEDTATRVSWEKTSLVNIEKMYTGRMSVWPEINHFAVDTNGDIWGSGGNFYGALGDGGYNGWEKLPFSNAVEVEKFGTRISIFRLENGDVWLSGENSNGQIGNGGTGGDQKSWVRAPFRNVVNVEQGAENQTFIITDDHEVWATGKNEVGQLGIGNNDDQFNWVKTIGEGATEIF